MVPSGQVRCSTACITATSGFQLDLENVPRYEQPYRMGGIGPAHSAAYLDILATRDQSEALPALHQPPFRSALDLAVDVSSLPSPPEDAGMLHILEGRLNNAPAAGEDPAPGQIRDSRCRSPAASSSSPAARSVTVVEVPLCSAASDSSR